MEAAAALSLGALDTRGDTVGEVAVETADGLGRSEIRPPGRSIECPRRESVPPSDHESPRWR